MALLLCTFIELFTRNGERKRCSWECRKRRRGGGEEEEEEVGDEYPLYVKM